MPKVTDDHYRAVGRVVLGFAQLEFFLCLMIVKLIDSDWRLGHIVASELSFRNAVLLAQALYVERFGEASDAKGLRSVLKRATGLAEERNQVVHSNWDVDSGAVTRRLKIKASAKQGLIVISEPTNVATLDRIADRMEATGRDLLLLIPTGALPSLTKEDIHVSSS
jgi:hypothetical protein